jgi:hypothetical protein
MAKEKILLGLGCSHASGAEIDGHMNSEYNRNNSFGAKLAEMLGRKFISVATSGATNNTIARMAIEWIENNYVEDEMDLFVLCPWTEPTRMEVPSNMPIWYNEVDVGIHYHSKTYHNFHRVNLGLTEDDGFPGDILTYQKFMADNQTFLQIGAANLVLQIQYYCNSKNLPYLMCNTMNMFDENKWINFYLDRIDKSRYMECLENEKCFFWYYRNDGYENPKARYWHHNEIPHQMYAEKLHNFIEQNHILDT